MSLSKRYKNSNFSFQSRFLSKKKNCCNPDIPCPVICLTVTRSIFLPDPPEGCEFALVDNGENVYEIHQWDGAAWVLLAGITAIFIYGENTVVSYDTTGSWVITLNGIEVSGNDSYTFDSPVPILDVVFINGQCAYVMEQIVPPVVEPLNLYATQLAGVNWNDNSESNFEIDGNGVQADFIGENITSTPYLESIYGVNRAGTLPNYGTTSIVIWVVAPAEPVMTILDWLGNPIDHTWSLVESGVTGARCWEALPTAPNAATTVLESISSLGGAQSQANWGGITLDDPAAVQASLINKFLGMYGSTSTMSFVNTGGDNFRLRVGNTWAFIDTIDLVGAGSTDANFTLITCP